MQLHQSIKNTLAFRKWQHLPPDQPITYEQKAITSVFFSKIASLQHNVMAIITSNLGIYLVSSN